MNKHRLKINNPRWTGTCNVFYVYFSAENIKKIYEKYNKKI